MIVAVTGATGFVGRAVVDRSAGSGLSLRALTRRAQPSRAGITWIAGALDKPDSLATLVEGADAVLHIAGVVNAPDRAGFVAGNIDGTRAIVEAAKAAGIKRFVHVSSLSAREPALSTYGWSKRQAEAIVTDSGLDWTIVRPSGIYGPGDMEMRDMFRAAKMRIALMPPPGKVSLVAVEDFARLLTTLVTTDGPRAVLEVDDGQALTHAELANAIGAAVGQRVMTLHLPKGLLQLGAKIDRALRGNGAKLTPDRVGYLCHPDWTADPAKRPDPALWEPAIALSKGLADTARWYRANGLL
ncbi:short chain dehydrogenase family protein [Sphingomonas sp. S17]|uniref:NAD(P)H-binding protein n=2 Tax=Sphingomonas paucimobilis TaxID=13689 RepID=A0A411LHT8_SPHPI|nr:MULTISPECIES: NAD(P)H-binding protein [Sphingomonas]EGI54902.1 short chain dehydrogenase family protein [Sphingomonas sp. S17]MBQ1479420.1 NAD(P)H-binding protein [Sphingomonas sp.]MCM3677990.1 NAD(P)H-binding protein [Sphingomonas paucimobilis]MDG5972622.1 NAD(P)H-binding protein [Sphingomonas paucimobilis]NNG56644.1 NAD(P)H-binding protein [Sphingomonas paucimobilis]